MNDVAQKQLKQRSAEVAGIRSQAEADSRKLRVRSKILQLIGGLPDYRGPLSAQTTATLDRGKFVIENVTFESLPGLVVSANLYLPKAKGPHPAVLNPMGHWEQGKAAAQRIASNLAVKGFVVLVYDPVGQGERQQAYDPRIGKSIIGGGTEQHFLNGATSILLGQSFARYRIWDGMRALDYLESRAEVDKDKIGCTGCSGGGTLATYLSALDPRIKVAAPACYINSYRTLFTGPIGDSEQSLPGFLAAGLDQSDYVELFAPKPWLILSTEGDYFTPAGAKQVFEEARNWYEMHNAQDRIQWVVGPGPHGMPLIVREAIYKWMIRWLKDGKADGTEENIELVPDHLLRAASKGQVSGRDLYEIIRETPSKPAPDIRPFVKKLLDANPAFGARIQAPPLGPVRKPAVIAIDLAETDLEQLRAEGQVVIVVAPAREVNRAYAGNWLANTRAWLTGHNLPAMHASEIRRAIDLAVSRADVDASNITAKAKGVAGVWLLLAAVADDRLSRIELNRTPHSYRAAIDSPVHRNLHDAVIPGFALQWDLQDLANAIKPRTVIWKDPTDWLDNVVVQPGPYLYTASANE